MWLRLYKALLLDCWTYKDVEKNDYYEIEEQEEAHHVSQKREIYNSHMVTNLVNNQEMTQTNIQQNSTINMHLNVIHDIKILKNWMTKIVTYNKHTIYVELVSMTKKILLDKWSLKQWKKYVKGVSIT